MVAFYLLNHKIFIEKYDISLFHIFHAKNLLHYLASKCCKEAANKTFNIDYLCYELQNLKKRI